MSSSSRTGYHVFLSEVMLANPRLSFGNKSRLASQQWAMMSPRQKASYAACVTVTSIKKSSNVKGGGNWFSSDYSPDFDPQLGQSKTKGRTWGEYLGNIVSLLHTAQMALQAARTNLSSLFITYHTSACINLDDEDDDDALTDDLIHVFHRTMTATNAFCLVLGLVHYNNRDEELLLSGIRVPTDADLAIMHEWIAPAAPSNYFRRFPYQSSSGETSESGLVMLKDDEDTEVWFHIDTDRIITFREMRRNGKVLHVTTKMLYRIALDYSFLVLNDEHQLQLASDDDIQTQIYVNQQYFIMWGERLKQQQILH